MMSIQNFQTMMAINASRDMLNNSNLPAFLYKCGTMNLLKATITWCDLSTRFFCIDATLLCGFEKSINRIM